MKTVNRFDQIKDATKNGQPTLSIGTLTADVMNQAAAVRTLQDHDIKLLHIDVMDGLVWPKITVGHFFVAGLKTDLLRDVHLLVERPEQQIPHFVKAGADMISFSVESCNDIGSVIGVFRNAADEAGRTGDVHCGLSVYPQTPLEVLEPYLDDIDYVTLLAVSPDSGKDNFLDEMAVRVAHLRSRREDLLICIDGAVKKTNIGDIAAMGADVVVTGSAVFDGNDAAENIVEMKRQITEATSK